MEILRYAAFTTDPAGGNRAGVVLDADGLDEATMLGIAAELGYSETAFLFPSRAVGAAVPVRYFSPLAEVPFCGHATIATGVARAERHGPGELTLQLIDGSTVPVAVTADDAGRLRATLTSGPPRSEPMSDQDLNDLLDALCWSRADLDPVLPPRVAFANNWHPIIAATSRQRLADLDYDFERLQTLCSDHSWITIDLVHRESASVFWARNPFPLGGVVEDPATGSAAASFGGYLRELGLVDAPAQVTVHQGDDLGRPGVLAIDIPAGDGGISVSGHAVPIAG